MSDPTPSIDIDKNYATDGTGQTTATVQMSGGTATGPGFSGTYYVSVPAGNYYTIEVRADDDATVSGGRISASSHWDATQKVIVPGSATSPTNSVYPGEQDIEFSIFYSNAGGPYVLDVTICSIRTEKIVPEPEDGDEEPSGCGNCGEGQSICPMTTQTENGCIDFSQIFGRTPFWGGFAGGKLILKEQYLADYICVPAALCYEHYLTRKVLAKNAGTGQIAGTSFVHSGATKNFGFSYLAGTDLIEVVQNPNNMTLTQNYEATRDLISSMIYKRSTTNVVIRNYSYDLLGRPTTRTISRNSATQNDSFSYNSKSELISATVGGNAFSYNFDEIGNRMENQPNALNQPTIIGDFVPAFDADGNMTSLQTSTGTWTISWNEENRPIRFENAGTQTVVECNYDYLGRRFEKKVTVAGTVTLRQRYIYRGFLQIACLDCLRSAHPDIWLVLWDPTQSTGTRPLAIQKDGAYFTFGWDITKNIWEVFGQNGYIRTTYSYDPFGNVSESGDVSQPFQWSSEFYDSELALVYYNYRHYIPALGRWLSEDPIGIEGGLNLYFYCQNSPIWKWDDWGNFFDFNFDYEHSVQLGGCAPIPAYPMVSICLTGGFLAQKSKCCLDCKERTLYEFSGSVILKVKLELKTFDVFKNVSNFDFSITNAVAISGPSTKTCPDEKVQFSGSLFVGINILGLDASLSYDFASNEFVGAVGAQASLFSINAYGGGEIKITSTKIS